MLKYPDDVKKFIESVTPEVFPLDEEDKRFLDAIKGKNVRLTANKEREQTEDFRKLVSGLSTMWHTGYIAGLQVVIV